MIVFNIVNSAHTLAYSGSNLKNFRQGVKRGAVPWPAVYGLFIGRKKGNTDGDPVSNPPFTGDKLDLRDGGNNILHPETSGMGNHPLTTEVPRSDMVWAGQSYETNLSTSCSAFCSTFQPFEGRWVGAYGCHGFELLEIRVTMERLEAIKVHGDPNVPSGQTTFEVDYNGISRGRVAEPGFVNPSWIPGKFEWDPLEQDDCTFHFQDCGRVDLIRVPTNFELTEHGIRTFVAQNWTRIAEWNGAPVILPRQMRIAKEGPKIQGFVYNLQDHAESHLCTICQFHIEDQSVVTNLQCDHYFHYNCAQSWLKFKHRCPLCNRDVHDDH